MTKDSSSRNDKGLSTDTLATNAPFVVPTPSHAFATDAHGAGLHRNRRRVVWLGTLAALAASARGILYTARSLAFPSDDDDFRRALRLRDEPERHHRPP